MVPPKDVRLVKKESVSLKIGQRETSQSEMQKIKMEL
jgi:hypothetical protein